MSPGEFMRRMLPKQARTQASREPKTKKTYRPPEGFPDSVKRLVARRSGGLCELDECGEAVWFHHRRPRGNGGTSLDWVNRAANCLHLSDECHRWVEGRIPGSSRSRSLILGWLVSMNGDALAADVEVWYRGQFVFLTDTGSQPIPSRNTSRPTVRPNFEEPRPYGP